MGRRPANQPSPPRYTVEVTPKAAKDLAALGRKDLIAVDRKIQSLAENPRPPRSQPLAGVKGLFRIRAGNHRILYQVHDDRLVVLVVRAAHRRESYRNLEALEP